jgi:GTPase SAR1 family protein
MGPEATVTLVCTVGMGWLILRLVLFVVGKLQGGTTRTSTYSSGALQEDNDDDKEDDPHSDNVALPSLPVGMSSSYDGTIVFCGPQAAGKTSLLDTLLHHNDSQQQQQDGPFSSSSTTRRLPTTVSSIQPTVGLLSMSASTSTTTETRRTQWRCLDLPGHWSPFKVVTNTTRELSRSDGDRQLIVIAIVLDATQPVTKAVDYLYEWLSSVIVLHPQQQPKHQSKHKYQMVVVAHKSDSSKAKNIRRLKLQVKQELERLHSLKYGTDTMTTATTTTTVIPWDQVLKDHVEFVSTTCCCWGEEGDTTTTGTTHALQSYLRTAAAPVAS